MQLLILLTVHAVVLLIVGSIFVASHKQWGRIGSLFLLIVLFIFSSVFVLIMRWMPVYILLLMVFGFVIGKETSHKIRVRGTCIISLAMLLLPAWYGLSARSEMYALQAEYPIVSLGDRLSYEDTADVKLKALLVEDARASTNSTSVTADSESTAQPVGIVFSPTVLTRLEAEERERPSYFSRHRMLERLHAEGAAEFAVADGFGITRRIRPRSEYIRIPDPEPIPFEESEPEESSYLEIDGFAGRAESPEAASDTLPGKALSTVPAESALYATHQSSRQDFLDAERFGYAASPQQVAGFEPHAFQQPAIVRASNQQAIEAADHAWSITRLELVSLLKFDEPRVYVSDVLPNMEELDQTETRPLSAFEAENLPQLVSRKDVVIRETPDEIRMLGSLRATNQCLKCHSVKRGYLLGAFSYTLKPVK